MLIKCKLNLRFAVIYISPGNSHWNLCRRKSPYCLVHSSSLVNSHVIVFFFSFNLDFNGSHCKRTIGDESYMKEDYIIDVSGHTRLQTSVFINFCYQLLITIKQWFTKVVQIHRISVLEFRVIVTISIIISLIFDLMTIGLTKSLIFGLIFILP